MAKIPIKEKLKVEQDIEDREILNGFRPYLGMSGIGGPCTRALWYGFRFCAQETLTPRKDRLLKRGHREEPIINEDLEKAGMIVHSTQVEFVDCNGHMLGHCDGKVDNVPDAPKTTHLLEEKTANDKNFKKFMKLGLQAAHTTYYGQVQVYMKKAKLTRTLFIVVNKNDDARYYERIKLDNDYAKELITRGWDIVSSEVPLPKIGGPTWFECKWCNHYQVCHFNEEPIKTCRTCTSVDICDNGVWRCSKYDIELAFQQQLIACKRYLKIAM